MYELLVGYHGKAEVFVTGSKRKVWNEIKKLPFGTEYQVIDCDTDGVIYFAVTVA